MKSTLILITLIALTSTARGHSECQVTQIPLKTCYHRLPVFEEEWVKLQTEGECTYARLAEFVPTTTSTKLVVVCGAQTIHSEELTIESPNEIVFAGSNCHRNLETRTLKAMEDLQFHIDHFNRKNKIFLCP